MPPPQRAGVGLLVVGLGTIAAPLDTAVNIAFPSITAAFALEVEDIRWVVLSYVLTYASLMLVFGKLGDLLGYRHIFRLGLAVSAIGFAGCGLAPTFGLLLVARILQGVGIALVLSCGPALATSLFPEAERARALGAYAAIMAAGSAIGPLLGGLLVERWGWSAVFWFRVPLVLAGLALSGSLAAAPRQGPNRRFDAAGALLLVVWMNALPLAFAVPPARWGAVLPLGLGVTAMVAFAAFLVREAHHSEPIIRPALFRDADFAIINAASIAMNLAAFAVLLLVPYYLVRVAGLEAGIGGAVLALGAGGMIVGAWAAGRLARRTKTGLLALAGVVLNICGLWGVSTWTPDTGFGVIALTLLGQGLGIGLFQVAYTDRVTATLPLADRGVAGSLAMVTRTIGVAGGATGLSATFRSFEGAALKAGAAPADAFLGGFQATFFWVAVALALCLGLSLLRPRTWLDAA
jgi:MFS family permease